MEKSESIGNLAAALAAAQGAMAPAKKDSANPFFHSKYADLAAIVDAIRGPLSANGLAYVQTTDISEDGSVIVETVLMHKSGEWIAGRIAMKPTKQDPQGIGSAVTYARRYGLQAIVGIPTDDDDGNAASGNDGTKARPAPATAKPAAKPTPTPEPEEAVTFTDPEEAVAWFLEQFDACQPLAWQPDAIIQSAMKLAQTLDKAGMDDPERKRLYEALTGKTSGKEMTPAQLYVLHANAGRVETLRAIARWWQERQAAA